MKVSDARDLGFIEDITKNTSMGGNYTGYGIYDCFYDRSSNISSVVSITVSKVINIENMEDVTNKIPSLPTVTTDTNGIANLSIPAPIGNWQGGSYLVEFTLRDENDNTDKGYGWFTVKNLWINVWPKQVSGYWKWYFSSKENMTFDVYSYNVTQGSYWWYGGSGSGTGDNCYVVSIGYQGSGAEWFWPPKIVDPSKYTWSCTGSNGIFNLIINHTEPFASGYYTIRVKVNTSSGISDIGDGWFSVKAYNVYLR
jgi:hypothetical protein